MMNARVQKWNGLNLVTDPRVPEHNYTLTNDKGRVLGGGDLDKGYHYKCKGSGFHGPATRVHAPEAVVKRLEQEAANGNRHSI